MHDLAVRYYKKLYIDKSKISGQGLFTSEPIKEGELILSFGGVLVPARERGNGNYMSSTFVGVTDLVALCEEKNSEKDLSDYINHSCTPNAGLCDCITIVAIEDIKKGDEICCDYTFWEANEAWRLKSECMCGSPDCRHIITGLDWKDVKSTDVRFKYYSPFIQRRILRSEKKL